MKTTLNQIRAKSPCSSGWTKLLAYLGKTKADDEAVSIITILDSNGLEDALWCLQAVKNYDREIRLFGVWCARQVQHLMTDPRSLAALDVSERFANGDATESARAAAAAAARAAARAAGDAAGAAAWAAGAARAAARAAAWAAGAAGAAAWAAGDAARAAGDAARDAQEKRLRELCAECEVSEVTA